MGNANKIINICNEAQRFFHENPHTNCGDKKLQVLRLLIKIHYMISSCTDLPNYFYLKDLLFSTYNLIHFCDAATSDCSSEYALTCWRDEGLQPKI